MADARLVATNPEDSSLIPVACTPEGLLKTEGGTEGPPGPKGDPGDSGDVGAPGVDGKDGAPGADGKDGEGLPKPYGQEGSYLWIKDGAPAWSEESDPPPPPTGGVTISMLSSDRPWSCYNASEQTVVPPNQTPDEYCRTQPSWQLDDNSVRNGVGSEKGCTWNRGGDEDLNFSLNLTNPYGRVLEIWMTAIYDFTGPMENPGNIEVFQTDNNVVPIRTNYLFQDKQGEGTNNRSCFKISYLFNRDLSSYAPQMLSRASYIQGKGTVIHGWRLVDPGYYALKQQMQYTEQVRQLSQALTDLKA